MTTKQNKIKSLFGPDVKNKLTSWEKKFISSLYKRGDDWSEKQEAAFNRIVDKYSLVETKVVDNVIYIPYSDKQERQFRQSITTRQFRRKRGVNFKLNGDPNKNKK